MVDSFYSINILLLYIYLLTIMCFFVYLIYMIYNIRSSKNIIIVCTYFRSMVKINISLYFDTINI
jgi:hypothetical protein